VPLVCCVLLSRTDDALGSSLALTLVKLLTSANTKPSKDLPDGDCRVVVCEALASLGGSKRGESLIIIECTTEYYFRIFLIVS